jgi:Zn-finger nucleic acid-binding protein
MSLYCPACATQLARVLRAGVEIDHCPRCRGVWLDRGELEKLIDREAAAEQRWGDEDDEDDDDRPRRYRNGHPPDPSSHGHPPPKQKGFFGRMFDFD